MKKIVSIIASIMLSAAFFTSCGKKADSAKANAVRIAMVTDSGDITDQSFNQTTYQACKEYAEANSLEFKYYKPSGDTTEARVS